MSSRTIDYDALAKQYGAVSSAAPKVDYDALAQQHGAVSSTQPVKSLHEMAQGMATKGEHIATPRDDSQQALGVLGGLLSSPAQTLAAPPKTTTEKVLKYALPGGVLLGAKRMFLDPQVNEWQKADQTQGVESAGHRLASVVPVAGPMAAAAGEAINRGEYTDAALNTIGALMAAHEIGPKVGESLNPSPEMRTKIADKLRSSAEKQYAKVLNPTKERLKFDAQNKVAPGLLDRNVTITSPEKLSEQAAANRQIANANLESVWDNLPEGTKAAAQPILDGLEQFKDNFQNRIEITPAEAVKLASDEATKGMVAEDGKGGYVKVVPIDASAVSAIEDMQNMIRAHGDQIPARAIRKIRKVWDDKVARAGGFQGKELAEGSKLDAGSELANLARTEIAKLDPNMADANAEYSFWTSVQKVADATKLRRVGQQGGIKKPVYRSIGTAAGSTVGATLGGPIGAAVGTGVGYGVGDMLARTEQSPFLNTSTAILKNKLAERIRPKVEASAVESAPEIPTGATFAEPVVQEQPKAMAATVGGGSQPVSLSHAEALKDLHNTYGVTETHVKQAAESAGAQFNGIWDASASQNGLQVQVTDTKTQSTFSVPMKDVLDPGRLQKVLDAKRAEFNDVKAGKGQLKLDLNAKPSETLKKRK